jgi:hypothetical protein
LTGQGGIVDVDYIWLHDVSGQVEVIEEVLHPHTDGFFKRFDYTISPDEPFCNPNLSTDSSMKLVKDHFAWKHKYAVPTPGYICLSDGARSLYEAFNQAIKDWLAVPENKAKISKWLPYKLRYNDTDVCRYATFNMRVVQALTSLTTNVQDAPSVDRREPEVVELMYALHRWRRQMQIWTGYLRMMSAKKESVPGPDAITPKSAVLTGLDLLKHTLLRKVVPGAEHTTSNARKWVKDLQYVRNAAKKASLDAEASFDLAGQVRQAVREMQTKGIVSIDEE